MAQTQNCQESVKIRSVKQSQPNLREKRANEYASHKKPKRERPGCTSLTLSLSHRNLSTKWLRKGLHSLEKACYNGCNRDPLANGTLIELLARLARGAVGKRIYAIERLKRHRNLILNKIYHSGKEDLRDGAIETLYTPWNRNQRRGVKEDLRDGAIETHLSGSAYTNNATVCERGFTRLSDGNDHATDLPANSGNVGKRIYAIERLKRSFDDLRVKGEGVKEDLRDGAIETSIVLSFNLNVGCVKEDLRDGAIETRLCVGAAGRRREVGKRNCAIERLKPQIAYINLNGMVHSVKEESRDGAIETSMVS